MDELFEAYLAVYEAEEFRFRPERSGPKPSVKPKSRERDIGPHDDWKDKPSKEWGERPPAAVKLRRRAKAVTDTQRREDQEVGLRQEEFEYIIDILVSEGYADNYDSAASILEAMSDEWLVGILSEAPYQILEEAYKLPNKKIKLRTVYHGTSVPNAKNIRKTGFKAGTRFNQDKPIVPGERIYVTTDKKRAEAYANEAGPLKYGYEVDNDQNTHKRSPIGAEQVTRDVSKLNSNGRPTLKNVNAVGRALNFITRRNKPKVLKLAMVSHVGSKSPLIPSKNERPDEHTISAKQADIGLRNSRIRDRMRRGTIPRRT